MTTTTLGPDVTQIIISYGSQYGTINMLWLRRLMLFSYGTTSNTVQATKAPLHIIDQGSVVYLILLQILLYNQQYLFLFVNTNVECNLNITDVTTPCLMTISTSYE